MTAAARPDRTRWRCKACRAEFSVTLGTLFAWHKLPPSASESSILIRLRIRQTRTPKYPAESESDANVRLYSLVS